MTSKIFGRFLCAAILLAASSAVAAAVVCEGEVVEGPWYSFTLPDGMELASGATDKVESDSIWINSRSGGAKFSFFLFAPRHGGKPYQAYLGSEKVTNFIEFDTENGTQQMFSVSYSDGSTGLFEGNAQKITGLRVYDDPLNEENFKKFHCFIGSIEQYAN
jgi:hypothetical protein